MTLITYKPARTILNEIDSLFDNFWNVDQSINYNQNFQPKFNISENKTSYFIIPKEVIKYELNMKLLYPNN